MKKLIALLQVLVLGGNAAAAPNVLTYQGRLQQAGLPFTGTKNVTVSLCDDATTGTCTAAGTQSVPVTNGLFRRSFSVPAAVDLSAGNWFLELAVDGVTLSPREPLTSAPFAVNSNYAAQAGGLSASPGTEILIPNPVRILGSEPGLAIENSNAGGGSFDITVGGGVLTIADVGAEAPRLHIDAGGNVGIGTLPSAANGGAMLHVLDGVASDSANWSGRVVASGPGKAVVMGELDSKAYLGGHSPALDAWADLYVNIGGKVAMGPFGSEETLPAKLSVATNNNEPLALFLRNPSTEVTSKVHLDMDQGGFTYQQLRGEYNNNSPLLAVAVRTAAGGVLGDRLILRGDGSVALGGDAASAPAIVAEQDGDVGLGTATPERKLHVKGDIAIPKENRIILGDNSSGVGEGIGNTTFGVGIWAGGFQSDPHLTAQNGGIGIHLPLGQDPQGVLDVRLADSEKPVVISGVPEDGRIGPTLALEGAAAGDGVRHELISTQDGEPEFGAGFFLLHKPGIGYPLVIDPEGQVGINGDPGVVDFQVHGSIMGIKSDPLSNFGPSVDILHTGANGVGFRLLSTGDSDDAGAGKLDFRGSGGSLMVLDDATGNLGIGTADPQAKLHIGGVSGSDGIMFPDGSVQTTAFTTAAGGLSGTGSTNTLAKWTSAGSLGGTSLAENGPGKFTMGNGVGLATGDASFLQIGNAGGGALYLGETSTRHLRIAHESGAAVLTSSGEPIKIQPGGGQNVELGGRIFIPSAGGVGIGTQSPATLMSLGANSLNIGSLGDVTLLSARSVHTFHMSEATTANQDSGHLFATATTAEDAGLFLDESDARKLKIAMGGVFTDATRTSNTKVTIQQDGRVGIGTTAPETRLHVEGSDAYLRLRQPGLLNGNDGAIVEFGRSNTLRDGGNLAFRPSATAGAEKMLLGVNNAGWQLAVQGNGNVGIGTVTPNSRLEVKATDDPAIAIVSDHATVPSTLKLGPVTSNGRVEQQIVYQQQLQFYGPGNPVMSFRGGGTAADGKVGIGNYTGGYSDSLWKGRLEISQMSNGSESANAGAGLTLRKIANQSGAVRLFAATTIGPTESGDQACQTASAGAPVVCMAAFGPGGPTTCGSPATGLRILCAGLAD